MNPNIKVHAAARINGVTHNFGEIELKYLPVQLGKLILETPMESRNFSTLEVRCGKRPINFESNQTDDEKFMEGLGNLVQTVNPDDFLDTHNDITHGEYAELWADPAWSNYAKFKSDSTMFTGEDGALVTETWNQTYKGTKFERLIR